MVLTLLMEGIILNKLFLPNKWVSLQKYKKDSKVQNDISQTIEKYNKGSYSTQSRVSQIALIQNKVFEQAINIMADTIEDMDKKIEQEDNKYNFLRKKQDYQIVKLLKK